MDMPDFTKSNAILRIPGDAISTGQPVDYQAMPHGLITYSITDRVALPVSTLTKRPV